MRSAINRQYIETEHRPKYKHMPEYRPEYEDMLPVVRYRRSPKRATISFLLASYISAISAIVAIHVAPTSYWGVLFALFALGNHLLGFLMLSAIQEVH